MEIAYVFNDNRLKSDGYKNIFKRCIVLICVHAQVCCCMAADITSNITNGSSIRLAETISEINPTRTILSYFEDCRTCLCSKIQKACTPFLDRQFIQIAKRPELCFFHVLALSSFAAGSYLIYKKSTQGITITPKNTLRFDDDDYLNHTRRYYNYSSYNTISGATDYTYSVPGLLLLIFGACITVADIFILLDSYKKQRRTQIINDGDGQTDSQTSSVHGDN